MTLRPPHWIMALALAGAAPPIMAQTGQHPLYASVTLASDYRLHGLSQTAAGSALRWAVDYERDSGLFAGGFATNVEYAAEAGWARPREVQANVYTGFVWRGREWTTSVSMSRYVYPDLERSYNYTEATATVAFRERFFLSAGYTPNHLSIYESAYHYEVGLVWPLLWNAELGANLGRFRAPDIGDTDYTHWDVGLSRAFGRVAVDVRYHANTREVVGLLGDPYGDRWALSLTYAIAPRGR